MIKFKLEVYIRVFDLPSTKLLPGNDLPKIPSNDDGTSDA